MVWNKNWTKPVNLDLSPLHRCRHKLQLALQSRGLPEVPPQGNPTNEMEALKDRLRKLETAGAKPSDKPPDMEKAF